MSPSSLRGSFYSLAVFLILFGLVTLGVAIPALILAISAFLTAGLMIAKV